MIEQKARAHSNMPIKRPMPPHMVRNRSIKGEKNQVKEKKKESCAPLWGRVVTTNQPTNQPTQPAQNPMLRAQLSLKSV